MDERGLLVLRFAPVAPRTPSLDRDRALATDRAGLALARFDVVARSVVDARAVRLGPDVELRAPVPADVVRDERARGFDDVTSIEDRSMSFEKRLCPLG